MKILAAAVVGLFLTVPAAAQDKQPGPTGADKGSSKELIEQCRTAALAKGLDADARRLAIAACILKARPQIAARIHCLMNSRFKDMDKKARLAFMKDCVQGKK
ncbi:MAG: hypothetical protein WCF20_10635 [Methylovirgula sp.]